MNTGRWKRMDAVADIEGTLTNGVDRIIMRGDELTVITQEIPERRPGGTAVWVRAKSSSHGIPSRQIRNESFTARYTLCKFITGGMGVIRIDIGRGGDFAELAADIKPQVDTQPAFWDRDLVVMEKTA